MDIGDRRTQRDIIGTGRDREGHQGDRRGQRWTSGTGGTEGHHRDSRGQRDIRGTGGDSDGGEEGGHLPYRVPRVALWGPQHPYGVPTGSP